MEQVALFLTNVGLWCEFFEPSFDFTDVVDRDTKVTDPGFGRAIPRLE
jgi:hypothetical protein